MVALVYLYEHTTLAKIADGFGISESAAHAYTSVVVDLLAERAPGLLKTLREHEPHFVLLDGTLAECDRLGDGRADYSRKHRRDGVKVQVVTDPGSRLLWLSPALPGRTHDLTAARTHRIIRICERQGVARGRRGFLESSSSNRAERHLAQQNGLLLRFGAGIRANAQRAAHFLFQPRWRGTQKLVRVRLEIPAGREIRGARR